MRVLAVGAHPDDVEVGCGATLALLKRKGHETYVLVLTKGEASGDPRIRELECIKASKILGVDKLFFGKLKDTRITDGIDTIMEIERIIDKVKPDILFAHSPRDTHQDHRNTGLAALSAGRKLKKILLYESPAALREFCPQIFVDIEPTFNLKLEAVRVFTSQNSKKFYEGLKQKDESNRAAKIIGAVEGLARFRGFQVGLRLAEAFEAGKYILEI